MQIWHRSDHSEVFDSADSYVYVRKVVNNGQGQEIWLDDPPEMTQRKNWRLLDGTSLSRDGSTRLGLFRDLEAIELKFYSI